TVDAAGLCLKSGNAALLRGSASAFRTNTALVAVLREAGAKAGLPEGFVELLPADRASVGELLNARGFVDVVIPRGGASLIERVVRESTVPVIETGEGNCHVYVDPSADPAMAEAIVLNAKTHRVSVCNSAETLLVHRDVPFLPRLLSALTDAGVTLHGDGAAQAAHEAVVPATDEDWATEYLSMDMAVRVVDDLRAALDHIERWGSGHSEAIVADSARAVAEFTAGVDAAAVLVNASTRFTDGGEFGFGAEIGISTQKLHARGPLGLPELTPIPPPPTHAAQFADVADVTARLTAAGYLPDAQIATTVFLADRLGKPLLVEGPAGTGKTELAKALATATSSELIRLQCYEGLDEARALYEWNYKKQLLRIQAAQGGDGTDWDTVHDDIFGEEFLLSRPLLTAIRRTEPTVLLIDETDKADVEVEGLLLEVLSDFQVTI